MPGLMPGEADAMLPRSKFSCHEHCAPLGQEEGRGRVELGRGGSEQTWAGVGPTMASTATSYPLCWAVQPDTEILVCAGKIARADFRRPIAVPVPLPEKPPMAAMASTECSSCHFDTAFPTGTG